VLTTHATDPALSAAMSGNGTKSVRRDGRSSALRTDGAGIA
jgi:hypothetical protein